MAYSETLRVARLASHRLDSLPSILSLRPLLQHTTILQSPSSLTFNRALVEVDLTRYARQRLHIWWIGPEETDKTQLMDQLELHGTVGDDIAALPSTYGSLTNGSSMLRWNTWNDAKLADEFLQAYSSLEIPRMSGQPDMFQSLHTSVTNVLFLLSYTPDAVTFYREQFYMNSFFIPVIPDAILEPTVPAVLDDILREIKFGYLPVGPQFPDHTRDGTSQIGAEKIREGDSGGVAHQGLEMVSVADRLEAQRWMFTHAGSNSVHERILNGMPMILWPLIYDRGRPSLLVKNSLILTSVPYIPSSEPLVALNMSQELTIAIELV
ncbi:hypothetical protein FIBSPDRAFT_1027828 [Athelia psychrophila]|uniref:Uncharacterized protein n=1 Tax=Athelia psychrophila TaxID=1759441 RepID=A0A166H1D9_9AGAM|nr:hypothetical protein FIBSPDRAFT_1027828 [Fibularhizoctonia sp. CBS 109695]